MTRYERAPMPAALNAVVYVAPDGEVVVSLKESLLEQHNEEAVALMLGEARRAGWEVDPPKLTAVDGSSKRAAPKHAARRSHRPRLLVLVVVAFFFASALSVAAVSYQAGVQDDQAADASANISPLLHKRRRPAVCTSCLTPSLSQTPDGSGAPALSSPAPRRRTARECARDIRRWRRRIWCDHLVSPSPSPGESSPPAPWPRPSYQSPAAGRASPQPRAPYAQPLTAFL